jgi:hypothetical protein
MDAATDQPVTTATVLVLYAPDNRMEMISFCMLPVVLVASMHATDFLHPMTQIGDLLGICRMRQFIVTSTISTVNFTRPVLFLE